MTNDMITKTNDGYVVEIFAKTKKELKKEFKEIAQGITLLETECNKKEEEQFLIYKEILETMEDDPVVIKICEKDEETVKAQLRALLRAGKYGDLSIIFPNIATVAELTEYKEMLEVCKTELKVKDIPYRNRIKIGVVVEIPSASLMSYEIARECDFLFIDTDSLINYTFGKKAKNTEIDYMQKTIQPAIIKLIRAAVEGAHDAGIYCGISGEIVENDLYIPLLIGLGIDEFSMDYKNILKSREVISKIDKYDCKELAEEIINLRSIEEIEKKLKQFERI